MMDWVDGHGQVFTQVSVALLSATWTLAWFFIHCLIPTLRRPSIITIGSYVRVVHKTNQRLDGARGSVLEWDSSVDRWKVQLDNGDVVPAKPDQLLLTGVPDSRRGSRRAPSPKRQSTRSGSSDDSTAASASPASRQPPRPSLGSEASRCSVAPAPRPSQNSEASRVSAATIATVATVASVRSSASRSSRFEVESGEDLYLKRPATLASEIGDLAGLRSFRQKVYRDVIYVLSASLGIAFSLSASLFAEQEHFRHPLTSFSWHHQVLFTMSAGHFAAKIGEDWSSRAYNALGICNSRILLLPCLTARTALFVHNFLRHVVRLSLCAFTLATWGFSGFVAVSLFADAHLLLLARRDLGFSRQVPPSWLCEFELLRGHWIRTHAAFLLGRVPAVAVLGWFLAHDLFTEGHREPRSALPLRFRLAFLGLVGAFALTSMLEMALLYSCHCTDLIWASTFHSRPKLMKGKVASRSHLTIIASKSQGLTHASTWAMKSAPCPQTFNVDGSVTMNFWDQQNAAVGEWKMSRDMPAALKVQEPRKPMRIRRNSLGIAGSGMTLEDLRDECCCEGDVSPASSEEQSEPSTMTGTGSGLDATWETRRSSRSSRPSLGTLCEDPEACGAHTAVELPPARIRTLGIGGRSANDPKWHVFYTFDRSVAPQAKAGELPFADQV